ncbi:MAG TPA: hypothetical protein VJZ32_10510 [Candidatus Bathyarchaeia archaeon]|nr:hypothetical protein [Candidatus Bathyarchaeia archaeon]
MAKRYNIYRVTWKEDEIEYVEKFVDESVILIQQVPERFKTKTGKPNIKIVRVEDLGFVP